MSDGNLARFAWLSIAAAVATLLLKLLAWWLTQSVGLLSDALETFTNLGGAVMALFMLRLAAQPPDEGHAYGHSKAEYLSSLFEGALVLGAGVAILVAALPRLMNPRAIEQPGIGLAVTAVASAINFGVARVLGSAGRKHHSIALEADSKHLMADVWTSAAVIAGVSVVALSGWRVLDPLLAMAVSLHVFWAGFGLLRDSAQGLLDAAWPEDESRIQEEVLAAHAGHDVAFHAVRTRRSAKRRFVSFHVLVPGSWSVQKGHDLLEVIEHALSRRLPHVTAFTHLEPIEDAASYDDIELDRPGAEDA